MLSLYVFVLAVGAVGALAYLALFMSHVPGAADERLGKWEPLPEDLGEWVADFAPGEDGLIRECRHLSLEPSNPSPTRLVLQVRYRDPRSGEIVRVEPEVTVKRRRIKSR